MTPKPPRCKVCRQRIERARNTWQRACSGPCAEELVRREREAAAKEERKADRVKREKLKRRRDWLAEAQDAINRYVRLRDTRAGHGCISCGKMPSNAWLGGGLMDCGHYRSRGSAPHLRFDLHNMAMQCKRCNDARYGGGMPIEFERGLRARIGDAKVDAVKADQASRKWSVDYLRRLKRIFSQKARREEKRMKAS